MLPTSVQALHLPSASHPCVAGRLPNGLSKVLCHVGVRPKVLENTSAVYRPPSMLPSKRQVHAVGKQSAQPCDGYTPKGIKAKGIKAKGIKDFPKPKGIKDPKILKVVRKYTPKYQRY